MKWAVHKFGYQIQDGRWGKRWVSSCGRFVRSDTHRFTWDPTKVTCGLCQRREDLYFQPEKSRGGS